MTGITAQSNFVSAMGMSFLTSGAIRLGNLTAVDTITVTSDDLLITGDVTSSNNVTLTAATTLATGAIAAGQAVVLTAGGATGTGSGSGTGTGAVEGSPASSHPSYRSRRTSSTCSGAS